MTTKTAIDVRPSLAPTAAREHAQRARARRATARAVARHVLLVALTILLLYPLLWLIVSSLRPNDQIFREPGLWPLSFDIDNYTKGWSALNPDFGQYLLNSTIVVAGSILGNLVSCSLAAYAFARLSFPGRRIMFGAMLVTLMLPIHAIIVPQYILFNHLGMTNSFWPLLLPKFLGTDAFFIFLMVQFIRAIPRELDEAARIDGAGHFRIFFQIMLPLMVPALATTAIFTFVWVWNDFFGPLIYLTDPTLFTVPLALNEFRNAQGASNFGGMFAMSVVSLLPVFLAFVVGQRFLIRGIATTGIK
ncbi:carbohydrate ABC transporter permease [Pseudolysinimonas sp.]|uniref:carbohydrate ABC transporter permease n=1 Tax=Pseudolysinimonas sp. TaxID=2680009 RepID=UPI003F7FA350